MHSELFVSQQLTVFIVLNLAFGNGLILNTGDIKTAATHKLKSVNMVCVAIGNWKGLSDMDAYCQASCTAGQCSPAACSCVQVVSNPTPANIHRSTPSTTTTPSNNILTSAVSSVVRCKAINQWAGRDYFDNWCTTSCAKGNCPPDACACPEVSTPTQSTTKTGLSPSTCRAGVTLTGDYWDAWCKSNCAKGYCPYDYCICN